MTTAIIDGALGLAVLLGWLAAAGFARLRTPLDRLHCVAFFNVGCGGTVLLAAVIADGLSVRVGKLAVVVGFGLLTSAVAAHATGRALRLRGSAVELE